MNIFVVHVALIRLVNERGCLCPVLSAGMPLPRPVVLTLPSQHLYLPRNPKSNVFPPQFGLRVGGRRFASIFRHTEARLRMYFLFWVYTRTPLFASLSSAFCVLISTRNRRVSEIRVYIRWMEMTMFCTCQGTWYLNECGWNLIVNYFHRIY